MGGYTHLFLGVTHFRKVISSFFPSKFFSPPWENHGKGKINISERKKAEGLIREQMLLLENKNNELERFNYIASHDLQEPLRTILNFIQVIEEDFGTKLEKEVVNYLSIIRSSSIRMQTLIRALLDFSRLGKTRVPTQISVAELLKMVTSDLHQVISETNASIKFTELPIVVGVETELRQLFQNLISNAIKFRKANTTPEIEIGFRNCDNHFEFFVSDNGIGIDPKNFDQLFWIFQRLNPSDKYEGYGIGLANCKKIIELHGGKIWVESIPEKGSIFKFTITK